MADDAKTWYSKKINVFRQGADTTLLTIALTTRNIRANCISEMEKNKPNQTILDAYGQAARNHLLTQDRPGRELTSAVDDFEAVASGWFKKDPDAQGFTGALKTLRSGLKKLAESDQAIANAYNALAGNNPGAARDRVDEAEELADGGRADVDGALRILGTLSSKVEAQKVLPKPKGPADPLAPLTPPAPDEPLARVTPQIPERHRDEFDERLAYFRVQKEAWWAVIAEFRDNLAHRASGYPVMLEPPVNKDLPPALIKDTAAARKAFSNTTGVLRDSTNRAIDAFKTKATGWFVVKSAKSDLTQAITSLRQGFTMLDEADKTLAKAFTKVEQQIAAQKRDFSEAKELSQDAETMANKGAARIEEDLMTLRIFL